MIDLPANVTFGANTDGFTLDQNDDLISSVQLFKDQDGDLNVELWGTTTVISPTGKRQADEEFQQNAVIEFTGQREFTWRVTRIIDPTSGAGTATRFQVYGTEDEVHKHRRI